MVYETFVDCQQFSAVFKQRSITKFSLLMIEQANILEFTYKFLIFYLYIAAIT